LEEKDNWFKKAGKDFNAGVDKAGANIKKAFNGKGKDATSLSCSLVAMATMITVGMQL